jgi:hypothetical protein
MHLLRLSGLIAVAGLLYGQAAARTRVIGVVTEAHASGATVKTDTGDVYSVVFLPETRFQKVAPGEKDLSQAQTISASDLAQGDRVLARGTASADQKTLTAQSVILMSARDIAQKNEKERAEWMHRGVGGLVVSSDPAAREIKIRIPSMFGQQHLMTVVAKDTTTFRRYAPDSVRFSDAKPSTLAELEPGDQLRALGDKNEDGTRLVADEVVSGSFRTAAGTVTALDPASGEVQIKELGTGKPLTIKVTSEASLRRLPQLPFAVPGGPGQGGTGGGVRSGQPPQGAPAGGPPGAGMHRGGPDIQQMIERMPAISINDIKPGETIIVSSTRGADPNRMTAVTLLAGADALIAMSQAATARSQGQRPAAGGQSMGDWNLGDMSMIPMP